MVYLENVIFIYSSHSHFLYSKLEAPKQSSAHKFVTHIFFNFHGNKSFIPLCLTSILLDYYPIKDETIVVVKSLNYALFGELEYK